MDLSTRTQSRTHTARPTVGTLTSYGKILESPTRNVLLTPKRVVCGDRQPLLCLKTELDPLPENTLPLTLYRKTSGRHTATDFL